MANPEPDSTDTRPRKAVRSQLRQGSVLPLEVARELGLVEDDSGNTLVVVVSHDCDCVQSENTEPAFEVLKGTLIPAADPNYTNAKSARTLHLECHRDGEPVVLQLIAGPKATIPKSALHTVCPDLKYSLQSRDRRTLSIWLRSRYSRASFPDELVERLRDAKVAIESAGKNNPYAIHGIYLYHEPLGEITSEDLYEIQIAVVYNTEIEGAEAAATDSASKIRARFESRFRTLNGATGIATWQKLHLTLCDAVADTEFTFSDTLSFQLLQLDYLSLRQDPQAHVPDAA